MGEPAPAVITDEFLMKNDGHGTHILVVDDEDSVRRFLCRLLESSGHACTGAVDAADARRHLMENDFELILCDVNMPGESGIDLIRYVSSSHPETAVIMVTGVDNPATAATALEIGVYGYIIKPFGTKELIINVTNALRRRTLEIRNRRNRENLEKLVSERTKELRISVENLRNAMDGIVQAMGIAIEARDPYTAGHQRRVARLASDIAEEMGLKKHQIEGIRMAGAIHDIGKISVPAEILTKPGTLNEAELAMMRSHPRIGYDIVKGIDFKWPIAQMVLQHHERMDGSGYPEGLSGDDIFLDAAILAVADVVEAMASHRPYRPSLGLGSALDHISRNKRVLYHPDVVDACLSLFTEKGYQLID